MAIAKSATAVRDAVTEPARTGKVGPKNTASASCKPSDTTGAESNAKRLSVLAVAVVASVGTYRPNSGTLQQVVVSPSLCTLDDRTSVAVLHTWCRETQVRIWIRRKLLLQRYPVLADEFEARLVRGVKASGTDDDIDVVQLSAVRTYDAIWRDLGDCYGQSVLLVAY